jgi:hypothetical protein
VVAELPAAEPPPADGATAAAAAAAISAPGFYTESVDDVSTVCVGFVFFKKQASMQGMCTRCFCNNQITASK